MTTQSANELSPGSAKALATIQALINKGRGKDLPIPILVILMKALGEVEVIEVMKFMYEQEAQQVRIGMMTDDEIDRLFPDLDADEAGAAFTNALRRARTRHAFATKDKALLARYVHSNETEK